MHKLFFRILFAFSVTLLVTTAAVCQVAVERSKDKVIIGGKAYYIHIVKKGETSFSISKAYGVTTDELFAENPGASKGIREGQSLRVPLKAASPTVKPENQTAQVKPAGGPIQHKVEKGETVYSISKLYSITETDITTANPGIDIRKLSVGTVLSIPAKSAQKTEVSETDKPVQAPPAEIRRETPVQETRQDENYLLHKVVKGESIAAIAEKYGVTVRDIRRVNRGLTFPKVDEEIRIPVERIKEVHVAEVIPVDTAAVKHEEKTEEMPEPGRKITEIENLRGKVKVAMLLPLYLRENRVRTEIDSSQVIKGKRVKKTISRPEDWIFPGTMPFLELYSGALIAADSLRALGLDVEMNLFDIKEDTADVDRLIESGKLDEMDLIVGPVFSWNLNRVSRYAAEKEIPVVSPVPLSNTGVLRGNPTLFVVNPSLDVAQEAIANHLRNMDTCHFVLVRTDSGRYDDRVNRFRERVVSAVTGDDTSKTVSFREIRFLSRSMLKKDSLGRLERVLDVKKTNVVLIASEDAPVISETLMDLHTLSRKYRISIVGLPAMRDLENLDPKFYFDLGIELFSNYRIDYNEDDIKAFTSDYRDKFLTEPSEISFAWQGYDIAWYFITGVAMHGKRFISKPWIHNPDLLQGEYYFERTDRDNGFENTNLFLIKYTPDMEIVYPQTGNGENRSVNKN